MTIEELYADRFATVSLDRADGIVIYRRTSEPYPTVAEARASFDAMAKALAPHFRASLCLIIDSREAPGRNDAEFEQLLVQYRTTLFAPFRKSTVIVKTAVGVLQTARLERSGGLGIAPVFHDEAEARAYLAKEP